MFLVKTGKYCHQAGLKFSIDHIFNIPTETVTDYVYALKFYRQLKPSVINAYWLQYFPKTDIIKIALKQKILKPSDVKKINQGKTNTSLVVGIGGTDSFNPELVFKNFQFLFMILPILPNWLYRYIISKKLYLKKFQPPLFINILTKALVTSLRTPFNLYVYSSIIKQTLYFIIQNIKQKFTHV